MSVYSVLGILYAVIIDHTESFKNGYFVSFTNEFVGDRELVLKVRIQSRKESDFVEDELNR